MMDQQIVHKTAVAIVAALVEHKNWVEQADIIDRALTRFAEEIIRVATKDVVRQVCEPSMEPIPLSK